MLTSSPACTSRKAGSRTKATGRNGSSTHHRSQDWRLHGRNRQRAQDSVFGPGSYADYRGWAVRFGVGENTVEGLMQSRAGRRSAMIAPLDRRRFLAGAGATGLSLAGPVQTLAQPANVDHTIHITPVSLELAPGHVIRTYGCNNMVRARSCACKRAGRPASRSSTIPTSTTSSTGTACLSRPRSMAQWRRDHRWSPLAAPRRSTPSRPGRPGRAGIIVTMWPEKTCHAACMPVSMVSLSSNLRAIRAATTRGAARRAPLGGPLGQYAGPSQRATA